MLSDRIEGGLAVSKMGCAYVNLVEVKLAAGGRPISPISRTLCGEAAIGGLGWGGWSPRV